MGTTTIRAYHVEDWNNAGLKSICELADDFEFRNQQYEYGSLSGEWFVGDEESLTIYWGTFGNDHCVGYTGSTFATIYETRAEYDDDLRCWEEQEEFLEEEYDHDGTDSFVDGDYEFDLDEY
jgi:hypothetical protein